jgi:phosphinothricin acetyltransferase
MPVASWLVKTIHRMNVSIRFAEPQDAAAIQAIYAPNVESTAISFELVPPTVEDMAERIARIAPQFPWLVCEIDGQVAGYVYACSHRERAAYRWAVDVTVYVDTAHRRRGVGRALYTSLLELLRQQGYSKAYAGITLPNPGSVGVHEVMGFEPVAVYRGVGYKLGRWRDVGWWQLELLPEVPVPREPKPIRDIRHTPAAMAALSNGEKLFSA